MIDPFTMLQPRGDINRPVFLREDSHWLREHARPKANHGERAHSKFAASASERWLNCPGSVELSEGMPDRSSKYAEEGTFAHEVLEATLLQMLGKNVRLPETRPASVDERAYFEVLRHVRKAAHFLLDFYKKNPGSDFMVETKIHLDFIHPEMFGTFDSAVLDHFGTLHVFDFKYGMTPVSVKYNLQMIFYAMGLAHKHHWNFDRVRMWIIQPRIPGYDGPTFWDISIRELRSYVSVFREGVERVLARPDLFKEDPSWCHYCKGKSKCPLKLETKWEDAKSVFSTTLLE